MEKQAARPHRFRTSGSRRGPRSRRGRVCHLWCRLEAVLADGFNGLFVEAHAERANDVHVLRIAVRVDDETHHADALILLAARLVGEFRFTFEEERGRNDAGLAGIEDADAVAGAQPRSPLPGPYSPFFVGADTVGPPGPLDRRVAFVEPCTPIEGIVLSSGKRMAMVDCSASLAARSRE